MEEVTLVRIFFYKKFRQKDIVATVVIDKF